MYKLVAIDLDGTLLNSYGEVTPQNKQAIQKTVEKGVEVVLASGRPMSSVRNLADDIGANHFMICGNGAITYDLQNSQIVFDRFLEKSKVLQLIQICDENSIYYNVYTEDVILTKVLNYNVLFYQHENANKEESKKTRINVVQDIYQYVKESKDQNFLKITICDNDKSVFQSIIRKLQQVKDIEVLEVAHMSRKMIKDGTQDVSIQYYYTEITNQQVDKWFALEQLADQLGIKKEEILTIGDNVNDKKMIEEAGLGVAMENSAPYVKEIADFICLDNDQSGVAQAIQKFILSEEGNV